MHIPPHPQSRAGGGRAASPPWPRARGQLRGPPASACQPARAATFPSLRPQPLSPSGVWFLWTGPGRPVIHLYSKCDAGPAHQRGRVQPTILLIAFCSCHSVCFFFLDSAPQWRALCDSILSPWFLTGFTLSYVVGLAQRCPLDLAAPTGRPHYPVEDGERRAEGWCDWGTGRRAAQAAAGRVAPASDVWLSGLRYAPFMSRGPLSEWCSVPPRVT